MGGHVFPRHCHAELPVAVAGDGCWLIDREGRRYFDACGGAAVSCLGHSDRDVIAAIREQLDRLPWAHTAFFTSEPAEELADLLVAHAPAGLERVYFVSGGSEAMEAALKLARQYFVELGEPQRRHVIARWQSYHGNTLGALAAGGNRWRRAQFEPLLVEMQHISPCYAYRGQGPGESPEVYGQRVADELDEMVGELGPETVIAFVAEPVVGATMGAVPAVPGYFRRVREICDRHGILLILDEVMCGMGRTGTLFACERDGVAPDIVAIAKGLGAGYQPIGAMIASGRIYDAIAQGSGFFQHGHTYMGHPAACAGALAVLRKLTAPGTMEHVRRQGDRLRAALQATFGDHPHVGDVRGRGLFLGLELVRDRATKAPFDPELRLHTRIKRAAMEAGLMCYPMAGTIDGVLGDHVLLAPPCIIEEGQIGLVVERLEGALALAIRAAVNA
jgi:adenosylmethionine-8-amino-7-oxononanoate aminotransferase